MNTPLRSLQNAPSAQVAGREGQGALLGIARHVSDEGCQLAISGPMPRKGSRLAMLVDPGRRIAGNVTWVVEDRLGFAFDTKLAPAMVTELRTHLGLSKATRLVPEPN